MPSGGLRGGNELSNLIAAYLFLGGAGSGAFFLAVVVGWLADARSRRGKGPLWPSFDGETVRRAVATAFALLVLGVVCLLLDLERPDRAHLLFLRPTVSYITVGAYLLAALLVCSFVLVVRPWMPKRGVTRFFVSASKAVGAVVSVGVMAYTGLLLGSMGAVPLWDSWLLPVLFVASSLASGTAVLLACSSLGFGSRVSRARFDRALATLDLVLTAVQVVVAAFLLWGASAHPDGLASVRSLLLGDWAAAFVGGYVILGLAVPTVLDVAAVSGRQRSWTGAVTAGAVLAGCFCLRLGLMGAGVHVGLDGIGI